MPSRTGREYGAPPQIRPKRLGDYLEAMSKSVFQSGISWDVVNAKWPTIVEALDGFDAEKVAGYEDEQLDALVQDTRVIRSRQKLAAIIHNANRMIELDREHGSFKKYLKSHGDFEATVKSLRKEFKYVGDSGAYVFLYVVGEPVPEHEAWMKSREGVQKRSRSPRTASK